MKNIALIKSIVATSISSANPAELTEHIAALIQAHPEETRENALAILTGTAELTVRPVDQVELTCNSSNYTNLSFMGEPTVNLLEGTVCCSINYTRTETRWYKTEEDANAGRNGSYNHDDYVIAREKAYKDSTNYQTMVQTVFHNLLIEAESMSDVHNCGTARPRYTYQEPLKLQNVDKVTEEDRALMDVARDMWAGVIKKGL